MNGIPFIDARESHKNALQNRADANKEIITKIRVQIMKAIDEGNTEFTFYQHIPQDVVDMLRATHHEVQMHRHMNETSYTISFKSY